MKRLSEVAGYELTESQTHILLFKYPQEFNSLQLYLSENPNDTINTNNLLMKIILLAHQQDF